MKGSLVALLAVLLGAPLAHAPVKLINYDNLAVLTIWQEARGESFEGKVAVGEVIRNRMAQKVHSDGTVPGTVLVPYQFSGFNSKDPNRVPSFKLDDEDPVCASCKAAWEMSATTALTKGATYYYAPSTLKKLGIKDPAWAVPEKHVATVGRHEFYRG